MVAGGEAQRATGLACQIIRAPEGYRNAAIRLASSPTRGKGLQSPPGYYDIHRSEAPPRAPASRNSRWQ